MILDDKSIILPLTQPPIDNDEVNNDTGPFLSKVDLKIQAVYSDIICQDGGTKIDGGVKDDARW